MESFNGSGMPLGQGLSRQEFHRLMEGDIGRAIMNDRKKQIVNLIIKIIILVFLHFACSYAIACWAIYVKWSPKLYFLRMEDMVQELLFMTVFQVFIYINYIVKRLIVTKYKIIYIITDLLFFAVDILVLVCNYSWIIMAS